MKSVRNLPASVRQRLLDRARKDKRPFNELLQYYAMERFLYRLACSAHAKRFILKGALMLRVWRSPEIRPTMDINMLGRVSNDEAGIVTQIREIMTVEVALDGLCFEPATVHAERITEGADYAGIRIRFRGVLDTARVTLQIDIGFGDIIYPGPVESDLPAMLDFPAPRLLCYSRESAIAEMFVAMVKLGILNSRMKDFYDIWLLCRQFDFDGASLAEAIRLTFERRETPLTAAIDAFSESFVEEKQLQWTAFWRRLEHEQVPASFHEVVIAVAVFLAPLAAALSQGHPVSGSWAAPGPWSWIRP